MCVLNNSETPFETQILALVHNSFRMYKYNSYSRGYHASKDVWRPSVSNESLICEQEETSELDMNGASIIFNDCILKCVSGHVLFNWNNMAAKILQFSNYISVVVSGKQVNWDSRSTCWLYFLRRIWNKNLVKESFREIK